MNGIRLEHASLIKELERQDKTIDKLHCDLAASGAERVEQLENELRKANTSRDRFHRVATALRVENKILKDS